MSEISFVYIFTSQFSSQVWFIAIKYLRSMIKEAVSEKLDVEGQLQYYDSLLDQDPYLQQQRALERALGRTDGIQAFQNAIVEISKIPFLLCSIWLSRG
jgi:hypothetical protein